MKRSRFEQRGSGGVVVVDMRRLVGGWREAVCGWEEEAALCVPGWWVVVGGSGWGGGSH